MKLRPFDVELLQDQTLKEAMIRWKNQGYDLLTTTRNLGDIYIQKESVNLLQIQTNFLVRFIPLDIQEVPKDRNKHLGVIEIVNSWLSIIENDEWMTNTEILMESIQKLVKTSLRVELVANTEKVHMIKELVDVITSK